jgi:hypothetical protein
MEPKKILLIEEPEDYKRRKQAELLQKQKDAPTKTVKKPINPKVQQDPQLTVTPKEPIQKTEKKPPKTEEQKKIHQEKINNLRRINVIKYMTKYQDPKAYFQIAMTKLIQKSTKMNNLKSHTKEPTARIAIEKKIEKNEATIALLKTFHNSNFLETATKEDMLDFYFSYITRDREIYADFTSYEHRIKHDVPIEYQQILDIKPKKIKDRFHFDPKINVSVEVVSSKPLKAKLLPYEMHKNVQKIFKHTARTLVRIENMAKNFRLPEVRVKYKPPGDIPYQAIPLFNYHKVETRRKNQKIQKEKEFFSSDATQLLADIKQLLETLLRNFTKPMVLTKRGGQYYNINIIESLKRQGVSRAVLNALNL